MAKPADPSFTILYFAVASTYTGKNFEQLPAPLPTRSLFATLESRYPGITAKVLRSCAVTVNLEYVDLGEEGEEVGRDTRSASAVASDGLLSGEDEIVIQTGDEVGIIPPVSSG